ncbi:MAG: hypothetical protein ACRDZV_15635, partial [Acidimicrobiia bacterium]
MAPDVVAILKRAQPPDIAVDAENLHGLILLNRLSNTDRHSKLPVLATGLDSPSGTCRTPDGRLHGVESLGPNEGVQDGTNLVVPKGAMDVQLTGTPVVVIRVGTPDGGYKVPEILRDNLLRGSRQLADRLRPFDRRVS